MRVEARLCWSAHGGHGGGGGGAATAAAKKKCHARAAPDLKALGRKLEWGAVLREAVLWADPLGERQDGSRNVASFFVFSGCTRVARLVGKRGLALAAHRVFSPLPRQACRSTKFSQRHYETGKAGDYGCRALVLGQTCFTSTRAGPISWMVGAVTVNGDVGICSVLASSIPPFDDAQKPPLALQVAPSAQTCSPMGHTGMT